MKGLGDIIDTTAKMTGIKAVIKKIEKVTQKPCGCESRRKYLNRKFPLRHFTKT